MLRFALGGLTTVVAGIIADMYGPAVGGLFLAFPAIFCASATLIEKHERKRKQEHGLKGHRRGTDPAALDASGAAIGSVGLAAFALAVWLLAPGYGFALLLMASIAWLLVRLPAGVCTWISAYPDRAFTPADHGSYGDFISAVGTCFPLMA